MEETTICFCQILINADTCILQFLSVIKELLSMLVRGQLHDNRPRLGVLWFGFLSFAHGFGSSLQTVASVYVFWLQINPQALSGDLADGCGDGLIRRFSVQGYLL